MVNIFCVLVGIGSVVGVLITMSQAKTSTDLEIRVVSGVPSENIGVIEFGVTDRWDYHRVVFIVQGFDEGLKLDKVVCYDGEKKYYFNQLSELDKCWDRWLKRFQEVLAEATLGEKNTGLLDPNTIPVS